MAWRSEITTRQGYDLQLTRYDERGCQHSPTSATGTGADTDELSSLAS
jgi:hypothetical protein